MLDELPMEVCDEITQYLSLKECVRLETVSSKWRNAMRNKWRRLKKLKFNDPFFSKIFDILSTKNNDASCVDHGRIRLQELAVKIHNHVQTISINHRMCNRHVAAFMKKLYELATPKLRELTFERFRTFSESDAEIMAEVAQYIPLTLESLELRFEYDNCNAIKYFCDGFSRQTFTQLKSLSIACNGYCDFRVNALQTPNLKQLDIDISLDSANETVFVIDNLDQLTYLESISVRLSDYSYSFCRFLETATSHHSKFLQTLKKLEVDGGCNDEQLLSQIGRFSSLEVLTLPLLGRIDTAGQLRIVQLIGQGCANLKSLYCSGEVEDEVLVEVAAGFPNLSFLHLNESSVEQIRTFVNRLSVDRCMEIVCWFGPTEEEVQDSGILNCHPNIWYINNYSPYDFSSDVEMGSPVISEYDSDDDYNNKPLQQ